MPEDFLQPDRQRAKMITQDMFPGMWIEPKWSRADAVKFSPYYTMMAVLGAGVLDSPNGMTDFVSLTFEGTEHVIHKSNFSICEKLKRAFHDSYMIPKGYAFSVPAYELRYRPLIILDGLRTLQKFASEMLEVPDNITKMLWILPDIGPCGEYRSRKPFQYMNTVKQEQFYAEHSENINMSALPWFDVLTIHRIPPRGLLSAYQQMSTQYGKVLMLEYDDDYFNIPEWNHNVTRYGKEELDRFRVAMNVSDIIVASTETLVEQSTKPECTFHGPNLVDTNEFGGVLNCSRELNEKYVGYKHKIDNKNLLYVHKTKPNIYNLDEKEYDPIRILWAGSNTHDKDLEQIIPVVKELGEKYGMAINFVFFGYIPREFMEVLVGAGNTKGRLSVKDRYAPYIRYIEPVPYRDYIRALRFIDPDFAICPLYHHTFNLSKSPLKLLEMGALGVPCIATDYGPYKVLTDNDIDWPSNGLKIQPGHSAGWFASIELLIRDVELRTSLANRWHDTVCAEYSWNTNSLNRQKWDLVFDKIREVSSRKKVDK